MRKITGLLFIFVFISPIMAQTDAIITPSFTYTYKVQTPIGNADKLEINSSSYIGAAINFYLYDEQLGFFINTGFYFPIDSVYYYTSSAASTIIWFGDEFFIINLLSGISTRVNFGNFISTYFSPGLHFSVYPIYFDAGKNVTDPLFMDIGIGFDCGLRFHLSPFFIIQAGGLLSYDFLQLVYQKNELSDLHHNSILNFAFNLGLSFHL